MQVKDGDFASAIGALAQEQKVESSAVDGPNASRLNAPDVVAPIETAAGLSDVTAQELSAYGLRREPMPDSCSRFPPSRRAIRAARHVPRSLMARLCRSVGTFVFMFTLTMVYVGMMKNKTAGPDAIYTLLFSLCLLLPVLVWFKSRYVRRAHVSGYGYPVGVLASVPLFAAVPPIDLALAEDEEIKIEDLLAPDGVTAKAVKVQVSAATDLAFELSDLLVRPKGRSALIGVLAALPHAQRAAALFCQQLAELLGLPPGAVVASSSELSEDFTSEEGGALTFVRVVVRGGRALGASAVGQAIQAAAEALQQHYFVELDG